MAIFDGMVCANLHQATTEKLASLHIPPSCLGMSVA